jgi:hypothetical protein
MTSPCASFSIIILYWNAECREGSHIKLKLPQSVVSLQVIIIIIIIITPYLNLKK